jgi:hypothetical protein
MPQVWRQIAAEEPARFAGLQRDFIRETHYEPAARSIREQTGLDVARQHPALQEVLWSTAVQHGPAGAARIFGTAMAKLQENLQGDQPGRSLETGLIDAVYSARSGQFGSSTSRVRAAVGNRFRTEKDLALAMLDLEQA